MDAVLQRSASILVDVYFSIDSRVQGDWTITDVVGELDLATSAEFRAAAHSGLADSTRFALDLSDCALIDSVGLGIVVGTARRARSAGKDFVVVVGERSKGFFERTRLDEILELVERSELDALVGIK